VHLAKVLQGEWLSDHKSDTTEGVSCLLSIAWKYFSATLMCLLWHVGIATPISIYDNSLWYKTKYISPFGLGLKRKENHKTSLHIVSGFKRCIWKPTRLNCKLWLKTVKTYTNFYFTFPTQFVMNKMAQTISKVRVIYLHQQPQKNWTHTSYIV